VITELRHSIQRHRPGRFEVIGIVAVVIEHRPIRVGERRRVEVVVVSFLIVGRLLQQASLSPAIQLA
jgi:hypothetical protein